MENINARIPLVADELKRKLDSTPASLVSRELIVQWLHDYQATIKKRPVELPYVRPDFEGIKQALQADLYNRDSWRELIQAGVGETLLEWVATVGSYDQLSIQRSFQEAFLPTAHLTSSIYESARHLGVHILRKTPGWVDVEFENVLAEGSLQIPSYSQFAMGSISFFNRSTIVVPGGGQKATFRLYQGEVKIVQIVGQNRPFQIAEIGDEDFSVSDIDIAVFSQTGAKYERVTDGLWHYEGADKYVFYENSTANGNVEMWFGNGIFGRQPALGETLNVVYVKTLGDEVDTTLVNQRVTLEYVNDVVGDRISVERQFNLAGSVSGATSQYLPPGLLDPTQRAAAEALERQRVTAQTQGTTISPVFAGGGNLEPEFYRRMAPHIYAARDRAVSRKDHYAVGLQYPGMADLKFRGQAELGPKNRNFINSVAVTALKVDGSVPTDAEFVQFEDYMRDKGVSELNYWHAPAKPVSVKIRAEVYVESDSDFPRTESYIRYRILEQFRTRLGTLGYSLYRSDIDKLLKAQHFGVRVDYAVLLEPRTDIVISMLQWINIRPSDIVLDLKYSTRNYSGYLQPRDR